ncbi:MAG TPA: translation initiation factor IF-3 [Kiritimatiellia bacterium]|nr:translation initiation factor IF-3 [Kiritimatiellia bacterium]HMP35050.1 translation initiation factor IF-3 [Kiritimatiellia bacterium]
MRNFTRINHQIRVPEVRCVDVDGSQVGVVPTREALNLAQQRGLDLVEISPQAQPPVCRVMDYGKFKFEQAKKEKQSKKNQSNTKVKEVKYHTNVEEHDYQTKLRHIRDFLGEGHRVKVSLMFRGRENAHQELGYEVVRRVVADVADIAVADREPQKLGRFLSVLINPRPATARGK